MSCVETTLESFDAAPSVSIVAPDDGAVLAPGELIEFVGIVGDDTGAENLIVTWSSSVDEMLSQTDPDADGNVYLATANLSGGAHA